MAITDKDIKKLTEVFATRDEVVSRLDKVMGELEKAREDRVFAMGKDRKQDERLDSLEVRVEKVEAKVG